MKKNPPISSEQLNDLYEKNKSIHKVGSILNVSGDTVSRWLKFYNIKIKGDPKRFDFLRKIQLNQIQKEFVVGSLLGDGNIDFSRNSARLRFCHSIKQVDYLNWKKEIISDFVVQENNTYIQKTRKSILKSFQTITHPEFEFYHRMFYKQRKKIVPSNIENLLTPFSISIWFMDDGWRDKKYRSALFCTDSFTNEENKLLVNALKNKFSINAKLRDSSNRIVLYGENVEKLSFLIKQYIIPSMLYKLNL